MTSHTDQRQKRIKEKLIYHTVVAATGCKIHVYHWLGDHGYSHM